MSDLLLALTLSAWGQSLLRLSLASGAVLLLVLVLDLLLARRVSARWRAALYLAVFVRVLLPAQWASPVGLVDRGTLPGPATVLAAAPRVVTAPPGVATPPIAPPSPVSAPLVLHVTVVAALLLAWLFARLHLARSLRSAHEAGERIRSLAPPGLRVVEHATHGPAVFGILRPSVVVPSPLAGALDDEALAAVLRHEAAHVARRDPLTLVLVQVFTFIAWPLLPAWIAAWRVRGLMEQACDEVALREAGVEQRRAYGEVLIRVAEWQPLRARLALGMLSFGGGLAPRVRALRFTRRWSVAAQVALVTLAAVALVLASGSSPASAVEAVGAPPQWTRLPEPAHARLLAQAWIVEDAEAGAIWPVPGGLAPSASAVPVTSALSGLSEVVIEAMQARLESAVASGRATDFGGLRPCPAIGSASGPVSLRRVGVPYQLDLSLLARGDASSLALDVQMEWGTAPSPTPAIPPWGSLDDSRYADQRGALLPAAMATRLADGRWGFVLLTGRLLADSSPLGLIRDNRDHYCGSDGTITLHGDRASATGSCRTSVDLANWLRDLEDDWNAADVALVWLSKSDTEVRYEVTFRLKPDGRPAAQVGVTLAMIDGAVLPELKRTLGVADDWGDLGGAGSRLRLDTALLDLEGAGAATIVSRPMIIAYLGQRASLTGDAGGGYAIDLLVTASDTHLRAAITVEAPSLVGSAIVRTVRESPAWAVTIPVVGSDRVLLMAVFTQEHRVD